MVLIGECGRRLRDCDLYRCQCCWGPGTAGTGTRDSADQGLGSWEHWEWSNEFEKPKKMTGFDWDLTANDRCKFSDLAQP